MREKTINSRKIGDVPKKEKKDIRSSGLTILL